MLAFFASAACAQEQRAASIPTPHARFELFPSIDGHTTLRGFGQTCSAGVARPTMWRERSADAYAALQYLQAQSFVRADRVALAG
jgi:hypothetical protein